MSDITAAGFDQAKNSLKVHGAVGANFWGRKFCNICIRPKRR